MLDRNGYKAPDRINVDMFVQKTDLLDHLILPLICSILLHPIQTHQAIMRRLLLYENYCI